MVGSNKAIACFSIGLGMLAGFYATSKALASEGGSEKDPAASALSQAWMKNVAACCAGLVGAPSQPGACSEGASPTPLPSAVPTQIPDPGPSLNAAGGGQGSPGEKYANCICDALKDNKSLGSTQLAQYCTALVTAKQAYYANIVLTAIDSATAATCWAACYDPLLSTACNCAAMIEGGVNFADSMMILSTSLNYQNSV